MWNKKFISSKKDLFSLFYYFIFLLKKKNSSGKTLNDCLIEVQSSQGKDPYLGLHCSHNYYRMMYLIMHDPVTN